VRGIFEPSFVARGNRVAPCDGRELEHQRIRHRHTPKSESAMPDVRASRTSSSVMSGRDGGSCITKSGFGAR